MYGAKCQLSQHRAETITVHDAEHTNKLPASCIQTILNCIRLIHIFKERQQKTVNCETNCDQLSDNRHADSLRPQRRSPVTDYGSLLSTVGVEEQPVGPLCVWSEGERCPGPADVWRQSPHDGVVASEALAVVVVVDNSDLDGHAVEVDHTVDHSWGLGCCDA